MMDKNKIESILLKQGFSEFKWINPETIIVAQWVRIKCTFGCSAYGLGTCPPHTPSVEDCSKFFKEYKNGLIVKLKTFADKDKYPSDWSKNMTNKLLETERHLFLQGHQKVFLLNQTYCSLCTDCSGNRMDCKNKKKSRPSPEAFAVDVYETVRKAGMEINVISENPSEIHRFAFILID